MQGIISGQPVPERRANSRHAWLFVLSDRVTLSAFEFIFPLTNYSFETQEVKEVSSKLVSKGLGRPEMGFVQGKYPKSAVTRKPQI